MDEEERFEFEVEQITDAIRRLRVQHARVTAGLQAAEERLAVITIRQQDRLQQREQQGEGNGRPRRLRRYTNQWPPRINDQVRILNPKRGQRNFGVIRGFCADGKIKVSTTEGTVIRAQNNVACIRRFRLA